MCVLRVALLTVAIQTNSNKMAEIKVSFFFDIFVEWRATLKIKLYFLHIYLYYIVFLKIVTRIKTPTYAYQRNYLRFLHIT